MKNKGYAKFGGGGLGAQIRCIMGDVQVACTRIFSRLIFFEININIDA